MRDCKQQHEMCCCSKQSNRRKTTCYCIFEQLSKQQQICLNNEDNKGSFVQKPWENCEQQRLWSCCRMQDTPKKRPHCVAILNHLNNYTAWLGLVAQMEKLNLRKVAYNNALCAFVLKCNKTSSNNKLALA